MPILPTKLDGKELARRQQLVLHEMQKDGVDCLVMFNFSTWYPGPMKYLFDYGHQYPSGAIFAPDGIKHYGHVYFDPEIPENDPSGRLPEKRILFAPMVNATWASDWMPTQMLNEIKAKHYHKIGIAGMQYVPSFLYEKLTKNLPDCEFVEYQHVIDRIRLVKSPYEIELLKDLCLRHDRMMDECANFLRPGLTSQDICNYLIKVAADYGMTEFNIMAGPYMPGASNVAGAAGINGNIPKTVPGSYVVCMIECAGPYGQWSEISRVLSLGQPSDEMLKGVEDAITLQTYAAQLCVPGAVPSAVMEKVNDKMEAMGYYREPRVCIHGQSYEIVDIPYFGPGEDTPLSENSYLAIHPEAGNALLRCNVTDNYLVTPGGATRLMESDRHILVV